MTPSDLERETHDALRRLPSPRAPRSLTPGVMVAVRARREAPWHARPMTTWPFALQATMFALGALPLVVLGIWVFGGGVLQSGAMALGLPAPPSGWSQLLPPVARQAMEQASVVLVLWRLFLGPVLVYAAAVAVAVGCVFAVCAAALTWVVLGRVPAQAG